MKHATEINGPNATKAALREQNARLAAENVALHHQDNTRASDTEELAQMTSKMMTTMAGVAGPVRVALLADNYLFFVA